MSFLIDPALLYATGRAYRRIAERDARGDRAARPEPAAARPEPPASAPARDLAAGAGIMAVFWGVSIGLYLEQRWTRPVWRLCRAESGRDWMLNSGVLRIDWRRAGWRTHLVAALIFATYPLWLWLGMRRRGR